MRILSQGKKLSVWGFGRDGSVVVLRAMRIFMELSTLAFYKAIAILPHSSFVLTLFTGIYYLLVVLQ